MPELKRAFIKGRMNKDYDERLVPSGEYTDALNIQVSSSEGSDVGAIENILGNSVKKYKSKNYTTGALTAWAEETGSTNYLGLPLDSKCIGAYKHNASKCIYGLITSATIDCVLEYDQTNDLVRPIAVDTGNIFKFSFDELTDIYLNSNGKISSETKLLFSNAA